jgi:hypothetical protein
MNALFNNKDVIFEIKNKVEQQDTSLYSHYCIDNVIDENAISIVMTASNRSKQTYFTLKTISNSIFKNVQIILVDDSDCDPITIDELKKFNLYIDFIIIKRENKKWHNPLVNYNIGFQFIKGNKIIIQNAEVCHVGDVVRFVNESVFDNYYVFDVFACNDFDKNEIIYNSGINHSIFDDSSLTSYQSKNNSNNYHFLTALSKQTFDKIKGFSYDFTMGSAYDDNDFLLKIKSTNTPIVNIWHEEYTIGGIHLYHKSSVEWNKIVESNGTFFMLKQYLYNCTGNYLDITENPNEFYERFHKLI